MVAAYQSSGRLALAPNRPRAGLAGPSFHPASRTFPRTVTGSKGLVIARRSPFNRGLGASEAGAETAQIAGGAGSIAGAATAVGSSAGLIAASTAAIAVPVIGAAVALVALIASFIGGGCGNACIESAEAEQIYEVACDDLQHVAQLGMLGQSDYETGINALIQGGQQHMQALESSDKQASKGLTNLNKSTAGNVSFAGSLPATATVPLNLTQAQAVFIQPGASGWYSSSVTAGNQLALTYLQELASQQASQTSGVSVSPSTGTVSVLGTTFSTTNLVIGLAVIAGLVFIL